jgi:hypothetical protein
MHQAANPPADGPALKSHCGGSGPELLLVALIQIETTSGDDLVVDAATVISVHPPAPAPVLIELPTPPPKASAAVLFAS